MSVRRRSKSFVRNMASKIILVCALFGAATSFSISKPSGGIDENNSLPWLAADLSESGLIGETTPVYFTRTEPNELQRKNTVKQLLSSQRYNKSGLYWIEQKNELPETTTTSNQSIPDTIYPEIMVVVDYHLFKQLNKSVENTILYILSFWNSVDLRFRSLQSPKFRLNIAGIVIMKDDELVNYHGGQLSDFRIWFNAYKKNISMEEKHDVVIMLTNHTDYPSDLQTDKGACSGNNVAIINFSDRNYQFSLEWSMGRIDAAAHVLGRLFGARNEDYFGACGYGSTYQMDFHFEKHPWKYSGKWSRCSQKEMNTFFESSGSCLFNKPRQGKVLSKLLMGKLTNVNTQCQIISKSLTEAHDPIQGDEFCRKLTCTHNGTIVVPEYTISGNLWDRFAPVDGTPCGEAKICLNYRCLQKSDVY